MKMTVKSQKSNKLKKKKASNSKLRIYNLRCNRPVKINGTNRSNKKFKVRVCSNNGKLTKKISKGTKEKIIKFGHKKYEHYKEGNSKSGRKKGHGSRRRRNNFRSRHNCSKKKDVNTPGYWSCNWSW